MFYVYEKSLKRNVLQFFYHINFNYSKSRRRRDLKYTYTSTMCFFFTLCDVITFYYYFQFFRILHGMYIQEYILYIYICVYTV